MCNVKDTDLSPSNEREAGEIPSVFINVGVYEAITRGDFPPCCYKESSTAKRAK